MIKDYRQEPAPPYSKLSLCLECWYSIWAGIHVPANGLSKQWRMAQIFGAWTHLEDMEKSPGSQIWIGLGLAIETI